MVSYDDTGKPLAIDASEVVKSHGFEIGSLVKSKKGCGEISNLDSHVHVTADTGETEAVDPREFLTMWKLVEEEFAPSDASNEARNHEQFDIVAKRAVVMSALSALVHATPTAPCKVQLKPAKSVTSLQAYKKVGDLVLVPATLGLTLLTEESKVGSKSRMAVFQGRKFAMAPSSVSESGDKKALVAPAWIVGETESESNMEWSTTTVCLQTKVGSTTTCEKVEFPILRNTKPIKVGDELLYEKPSNDDEPTSRTGRGKGTDKGEGNKKLQPLAKSSKGKGKKQAPAAAESSGAKKMRTSK